MGQCTLRRYRAEDRNRVREICCDTVLMGGPVDECFCDRDIAADILVSYYTDCEPESVFIAECEGEVAGYIAGCLAPGRRGGAFAFIILPRVLVKAVIRLTLLRAKNFKAAFGFLKSFLRGEFFNPSYNNDFPASLHINIDDRFRGRGIGRELLGCYIACLRGKNVKGVHLRTRSDDALGFFMSSGFSPLYSRSITYFEHIGLRGLRLYILGKRLEGNNFFSNDLHKKR